MDDLEILLREHLEAPFPANVEKGIDYGLVDPVMIDADIYGWASRVAAGQDLPEEEWRWLLRARDKLAASLAAFPDDARPYYERVLTIADNTLSRRE